MDDIDLENITTNYSSVGKNSVILFNLDKTLEKMKKKDIKIKTNLNFMSSLSVKDLESLNVDEDEEEMNKNIEGVFNSINKIENNSIKNKKFSLSPKSDFINDKFKYHMKTTKKLKLKKKEEILAVKYNPKYSIIENRVITGPTWDKSKIKKSKIIFDNRKLFNNREDPLKAGKIGFKEFGKQTMRNGFPIGHDIRVTYEKKYNSDFKSLLNNKNFNDNIYYTYNGNFISRKSSDSKTINNNKKKILFKSNEPKSSKDKKIISIPNFKKTISRDKLNKLSIKEHFSGLLNPNYSAVQERTSYVHFIKDKTPKKKHFFDDIPKYYDTGKYFYNYNNHSPPVIHSFHKLTGRNNQSPLPCYMSGIFNRSSSFCMTDKSLAMNNYMNGKTRSHFSSFYIPSQSRNVNLKMLYSKYGYSNYKYHL